MSKQKITYKKIISICICILFFISIMIFYCFNDLTFSKKIESIKYATLLIVAVPAVVTRYYIK